MRVCVRADGRGCDDSGLDKRNKLFQRKFILQILLREGDNSAVL